MNRTILKITLLIYLLCLSACSTTNTAQTFTPADAKADQSVVYVYRPTEMSNALYSPGLNVDGDFKLYLKNGVSSRLSLSPGDHIFELQDEKKYTDLTPLSLNLKSGTISYIRVTTALKVNNTVGYEPYARSFKLTPVDEKLAIKEIADCCLTNDNQATKKDELRSSDSESSDGFSVDKTQNPFSH